MTAKAPDATTDMDRERLILTVRTIEAEEASLRTLQGEYMASCKPGRERIRQLKKDAKRDGIPTASLNIVLKDREDARKREAALADLEPDEKISYSAMKVLLGPLGDTELGQAALKKAAEAEQAGAASALDGIGRGPRTH